MFIFYHIQCYLKMYTRTSLRVPRSLFVANKYIFRNVAVASEAVKNVAIKSWKEIPGPSSLPFLGPTHHMLPGGSLYNLNAQQVNSKLFETYGSIVRLDAMPGMDPILFIFHPEPAAQILRQENSLPQRPGFTTLDYYRRTIKSKRKPDAVIGLITNQGKPWKEFRSTVSPVMMQPKAIRLYNTAFDQVALEMIDRIKFLKDENNMIKEKFDYEMNLWALESVGVIAFGSRIGCFSADLPEDSPVKRLIKCVHDLFYIVEQLEFKPNIWKYISTPMSRKAMSLYEEHENLSKYFIQNAIDDMASNPKSEDAEKSILEKLLELDEEKAHLMACDMLLAGVDTTANSVMPTMYLLAANQDKQTKLRAELKSDPDRKYLKACVKESLRMMPVVSGNSRITTKEYDILGYHIPKNTLVVFAHHKMSMMEKNFARPNEYIPERWMADKDDPLYYRNAHPFAYNPFGFGVRGCIGRRIAEVMIETFVARIFENFHVEWTGPPPNIFATSFNYFKAPFNFIYKDIKQ